jgi:membrane protease subunit (stomatin/prohibitin family)
LGHLQPQRDIGGNVGVFLEILEWFDETGEEMVHRLPAEGSADIKFGAQLVVRESQEAIFYTGGQVADRFGAGRHTLSTKNLPILTQLLSLPWGFKSPFRCEAYFINRKTFTNLRWGTREPVIFKDRRLGLVRLRAHGQTSFRIIDGERCIHDLIGTQGSFSTHDATDYLRELIISRLNDFLGENLESVFDLPAVYDEMGEAVAKKLQPDFGKYGLELEDLFITSITPPEEVGSMVDSQGGMTLAGDMPRYIQYQAARSIGNPEAGGSNGAQTMLDAGVGMGLGMMMPSILKGAGAVTASKMNCPKCKAEVEGGAFCSACGAALEANARCGSCDAEMAADARFCGQCGEARGDDGN